MLRELSHISNDLVMNSKIVGVHKLTRDPRSVPGTFTEHWTLRQGHLPATERRKECFQ